MWYSYDNSKQSCVRLGQIRTPAARTRSANYRIQLWKSVRVIVIGCWGVLALLKRHAVGAWKQPVSQSGGVLLYVDKGIWKMNVETISVIYLPAARWKLSNIFPPAAGCPFGDDLLIQPNQCVQAFSFWCEFLQFLSLKRLYVFNNLMSESAGGKQSEDLN